jgi:3-phosphoshikimate 1-carboxyvinyltransferase
MGARVEEKPDGLEITGGAPLQGAVLPSFGDHRIAMAFAVAGLFAQGETVIQDVGCVATSYPGFYETLDRLAHPPKTAETPVIASLAGASPAE